MKENLAKNIYKLSIIVPCYNEEKTLAKCIEKVIAIKNDHLQLEILIVDDCSTDNSLSIAQKLGSQYQSNVNLLTGPQNYIPGIKNKYYPTYNDQKNISKIFNKMKKPSVLVYSPDGKASFLHIFFNSAYVSEFSITYLKDLHKTTFKLSAFNCILLLDFNNIPLSKKLEFKEYFTDLQYQSKNHNIVLFCKNQKTKVLENTENNT
jgi:glycosyltransferase involved in cell wall biosynthesis